MTLLLNVKYILLSVMTLLQNSKYFVDIVEWVNISVNLS